MNSVAPAPQVIIVGAGPSGSSAAILLGQYGVDTLLLDRWPDVYPRPRAVHLDDEVYRVLGRMQVADEFARVSRPALGLQLVDRHLRVLGRFTRLPEASVHGYPQANMYDQPDLERVLRHRLQSLPSVTFLGGVEVTSVTSQADDRVSVEWTDVSTGDTNSACADFVLGADGANSIVRTALGASQESLGFEQRWLVIDGEIDADLGHWDGVHQVCDSFRAATYMRIGPTRHRWEFRLSPHESLLDYNEPADLEPLVRPWLGGLPLSAVTLVRTAEYTFRAAVADRWRSGPVFLLGDAAHLTPPFVGQGLGAGIRDANNLAWKLAGVLDGSLDGSMLETYESERRPHARALIRLATAMGITMTGGGRAGSILRRGVAPPLTRALGRFEIVGRGATPPLSRSALVDSSLEDRLAGRLAPNVVGRRLLDDQIGGSWTIVTRHALSPTTRRHLADLDCLIVVAQPGDELDRWMVGAGRSAALVRPDGAVLASGDAVDLASRLARIVAPARSHRFQSVRS